MVLDKGLLLKGLAGVAALGSVGGVGGVVIKNKLDERAAEEKKKNDKKEEVNGKLSQLGIEGCDLVDNDVKSPTVFTKECQLTKDQFQKIHFSNKDGSNDVNVEGWTNGNITLKIENKEGDGIKFLFKNAPSNLTITKSSTDHTDKFSIKANSKTEFEEKSGKLSKIISDQATSTKLKGYNNKFQTLSIPKTCRFDETEDEKKLECEIKGSELKTVNFSNKGDSDSLTLSGLTDTDKIKLIIDREGAGESESLKYKFKNDKKDNITIIGTSGEQKKMVLKASAETEFEEKENKLSKIISEQTTSTKLKGYNTNLGKLSLPDDCIFDVAETETSLECEVTGSELKNIKFSSKEDNNPLTLKGITDSDKIKLIIERAGTGETETLKYKFKNDKKDSITIIGTTGEQKKMVLKASAETKFEEKDEKLSKIISDTATSTKLKGYNTNLGKLSLPDDCIFDVADTDTSLECDVTSTNITKIKFSNKETNDLTISEGNGFSGLKLNISGSGSNLEFNFKGGSQKIKLSSGEKHVFIKQGEENEFKINAEALHKTEVNKLAKKVDLECVYDNTGNGGTCKKGDNKSYLNVSKKTNPSDYAAIPIGSGNGSYEKDKVKFTFSEDQDGYEGRVKFTFTEETIENSDVKLEKNVSYEIKKINEFDCLSKKVPQ